MKWGSATRERFDAIEGGVRARVRGFIETMLEEELCEALSRPRYGRRKSGEDAAPSVVGVRHGHRERTLTGTFGKTRIAVPRARLMGDDGKTREWRSGSLRADRLHPPDQLGPRQPLLFRRLQRRPGKQEVIGGLDSGAKRNEVKRSGFAHPFQVRQARLGKAS